MAAYMSAGNAGGLQMKRHTRRSTDKASTAMPATCASCKSLGAAAKRQPGHVPARDQHDHDGQCSTQCRAIAGAP